MVALTTWGKGVPAHVTSYPLTVSAAAWRSQTGVLQHKARALVHVPELAALGLLSFALSPSSQEASRRFPESMACW